MTPIAKLGSSLVAKTVTSERDSANDLLPIVLDPNVHIQEAKAATCDIRPGRKQTPHPGPPPQGGRECPYTRYSSGKRKIQTISTKCQ